MKQLDDFVMLLPSVISKAECESTVNELESMVFNKVGCEDCTTDCDTMLLGREEAVSNISGRYTMNKKIITNIPIVFSIITPLPFFSMLF